MTFQPLWKCPMVFSVRFANRSHGHCSLRPGGRFATWATPTTDGLCCSGTLRPGRRARDLPLRGWPRSRSGVGPGCRLPGLREEASRRGARGLLGSEAQGALEVPSLLSCYNSKDLCLFPLNAPFPGSPGLPSWTWCLFPPRAALAAVECFVLSHMSSGHWPLPVTLASAWLPCAGPLAAAHAQQ